jgi:hypothetical protein
MIKFFKSLSVFLLASILLVVGGLSVFILVEETRHSRDLLPEGLGISGPGRVSTDFVPSDSDGCFLLQDYRSTDASKAA